MHQQLTGVDVANAVVMLRDHGDERNMVLLEGPEDLDALGHFFDRAAVNEMDCGGKTNAVNAIADLNLSDVKGTLALVDRDFDGIIGPECTLDNVVVTDDADMDVTIAFSSDVLSRVFAQHSDRTKRERELSATGEDAVARMITLVHPLGVLRKRSLETNAGLKLSKFPVKEIFSTDMRSVDTKIMCRIAAERSRHCPLDKDAVHALWKTEFPLPFAHRRYVRGHDLSIAVHAVCGKWGVGFAGDSKSVERVFRAAFTRADLETTLLFGAVKKWSESTGYAVWASE